MKRLKELKRKSKSKKGSSVLEFAFGLLTFVLLAAFVVDIIVVTNKQYTVSQTANQIVRQMSVQGGVKPSAPIGYPGGNQAYMDSREMLAYVQSELNGANIKNDEWTMRIEGFDPNGYPVARNNLSNGTNFEVDYRNLFEFEISYDYKWTIIGQIIPPMGSTRSTLQKRSAVSEFKYANQ